MSTTTNSSQELAQCKEIWRSQPLHGTILFWHWTGNCVLERCAGKFYVNATIDVKGIDTYRVHREVSGNGKTEFKYGITTIWYQITKWTVTGNKIYFHVDLQVKVGLIWYKIYNGMVGGNYSSDELQADNYRELAAHIEAIQLDIGLENLVTESSSTEPPT